MKGREATFGLRYRVPLARSEVGPAWPGARAQNSLSILQSTARSNVPSDNRFAGVHKPVNPTTSERIRIRERERERDYITHI